MADVPERWAAMGCEALEDADDRHPDGLDPLVLVETILAPVLADIRRQVGEWADELFAHAKQFERAMQAGDETAGYEYEKYVNQAWGCRGVARMILDGGGE